MRVILLSWYQIQPTSPELCHVYCGPGHIQCIYSSTYSDFNIHLNVSALLLEISRQFNARYTANLVQILRTSSGLRYVNYGPGHIQCNYSSAYSGFNIRLKLSATLLEIIGHVDARDTANLVSNTAHIVQFTLCELWSRPYTKYILVLIVRPQYSTESICATIGDTSTIQCALY
jgi:hypothetical protein